MNMDRDVDMMLTGHRHPYMLKYKARTQLSSSPVSLSLSLVCF